MLFKEPGLPLDQFHEKLQELEEQPIGVGLVFRPLASFGVEIDRDRKRAERIIFDGQR